MYIYRVYLLTYLLILREEEEEEEVFFFFFFFDMTDSDVCRRALGCEGGGTRTGGH